MIYKLENYSDCEDVVQVLFKFAIDKPKQFKVLYKLALKLSKWDKDEETDFVLHNLEYLTLGGIADLIDTQGVIEGSRGHIDLDETIYDFLESDDHAAPFDEYIDIVQSFIVKYGNSDYVIPKGLTLDSEEDRKTVYEVTSKLQEIIHVALYYYFSDLITEENVSFDLCFTKNHPLQELELGGLVTALLGNK